MLVKGATGDSGQGIASHSVYASMYIWLFIALSVLSLNKQASLTSWEDECCTKVFLQQIYNSLQPGLAKSMPLNEM